MIKPDIINLLNKLQPISKLGNILRLWRRDRLWSNYDEYYEVLLRHAPLHLDWLKQANLPHPQSSIFSIGPGRGELELTLCQNFDCVLGYAETYPRYYQEVEQGFATAGLSDRIVERHQDLYQTFVPTRSYDLILSVHSWYSFGYDAKLLRQTLEMLSSNGVMLLTVTSKEDFFFRHTLVRQNFSAEELSQWATEQGFPHQLHLLRTSISADKLRVNGSLTKEAKGVIGFLKGKLWWQIPRQERCRISKPFRELGANDYIERVYGLLYFESSHLC
jgi:SAM-dependent methyltransferase